MRGDNGIGKVEILTGDWCLYCPSSDLMCLIEPGGKLFTSSSFSLFDCTATSMTNSWEDTSAHMKCMEAFSHDLDFVRKP